ncbi:nuclear transport factor 2 family protein [Acidihalobacter aeolianus]|uniref:nuclear transport factor 2 family protein n=1 Tax=Acidihalobacter aeolianus TaxID=2792603 RepID=UPI000A7FCEC7|nr:DUF4440 domain-containing protein [Acidihalobacter aeolianus]
MTKYSVSVVDGLVSEETLKSSPDPEFTTLEELHEVAAALRAREPLFHREAFGLTREYHERMTESDFWEVGASGRRYSREYIIESLEKRYASLIRTTWYIEDFQCREIAEQNYLVTYTLFQGERLSRRSTIWRRSGSDWKVVYHQGTLVE